MRIATRPAESGMAPAGRSAGEVRTARRGGTHDVASWFSVVALTLYVVIALAGAGGRALIFTFPLGCLVVGLVTYARSPALFVTFTFWLWLLTPLIRRVFDLRYGFHATSPLLLAPLVVSSITVLTLIRRRAVLRSSAYVPFVVAFAALTYAFFIGIVRQSLVASSYDFLTWLAPLLFGLHLAAEWRAHAQMRQTLTSCALWGLLFEATYGIAQWVQPPIWDKAWVVSAEMFSVGAPQPFVIRVFSTLNAPGPFSIMLVFALLIGLGAPQRWRSIPIALGIVALILMKGRSAWAAFFFGALVLQLRQPLRALPRQWLAFVGALLLAAPLITQPQVLSLLSRRAGTVANIEKDRSYQSRLELTRFALGKVAVNPAGTGLGTLGGASKLLSSSKSALALDSGLLEVFSIMGWLGGLLFMMSLISIALSVARSGGDSADGAGGAAPVVAALLLATLFGNIFSGVSGFYFWSAVGFATSSRTYQQAVVLARRVASLPAPPPRPRLITSPHTTSAA